MAHIFERYLTNQLHEVGPFFSNREYFNSSRNYPSFINSTIYNRPHESLLVNLGHSLLLHLPSFRWILTSLLCLYRFIPIVPLAVFINIFYGILLLQGDL